LYQSAAPNKPLGIKVFQQLLHSQLVIYIVKVSVNHIQNIKYTIFIYLIRKLTKVNEKLLKMENVFSRPVPDYGEDFEYVTMIMQDSDNFILLHAHPDVINAVTNVVR
jgi:hypothetical protein